MSYSLLWCAGFTATEAAEMLGWPIEQVRLLFEFLDETLRYELHLKSL
jgi:hypothetical protein